MNTDLGPAADEISRKLLPKVAVILEQFSKDCADTPVICWSCKKPITEPLDLDLAELPNRGEPMCGACRGLDAD